MWSVMNVVWNKRGMLWAWSVRNEDSLEYGMSWRPWVWPGMNMPVFESCLLWTLSVMNVVCYEHVCYEHVCYERVCDEGVGHWCGLLWMWSVMECGLLWNVVCYGMWSVMECGLLWNVVCYECCLLGMLSVRNVVCYECCLLWMWSAMNVVCYECGLLWMWSVRNVVC